MEMAVSLCPRGSWKAFSRCVLEMPKAEESHHFQMSNAISTGIDAARRLNVADAH